MQLRFHRVVSSGAVSEGDERVSSEDVMRSVVGFSVPLLLSTGGNPKIWRSEVFSGRENENVMSPRVSSVTLREKVVSH